MIRTLVVLAALAVVAHADPEGWHSLSTQAAWRGYKQADFPGKGWTVQDGVIHHAQAGGGGDIVTRRKYRNFELTLEWKVGPKANSGIMYGVAEGEGASYMTGPEYQILDDHAHEAKIEHSAGALYALYAPPTDKPVKMTGEWNTARIKLVGGRVEHWLNGKKLLEAQIGSDDWNARVKASKFDAWKKFGTVKRGHLCLQDHGDAVWYRNLRIRELAPEAARRGPEQFFQTTQWRAHNDGPWSWDEDGTYVCAGKPAGYLYTTNEFKNFILRLDWRWPAKPGNSGVLMRMTGPHRVWPRSIEAQLMHGNAGDFWNIGGVPMRTVDARRRRGNTKKTHDAEKPAGQWNRYEIIVDEGWIQLRINGQVVNEAWDCEEIAGRICLQSEGSPIHFRNVRVTPLED